MHKSWLLTNILHTETVIFIEIGDVVLSAKLHAVSDPYGCVICIKETFPIWMDILGTLLPLAGRRPEWVKQWQKKHKKK